MPISYEYVAISNNVFGKLPSKNEFGKFPSNLKVQVFQTPVSSNFTQFFLDHGYKSRNKFSKVSNFRPHPTFKQKVE